MSISPARKATTPIRLQACTHEGLPKLAVSGDGEVQEFVNATVVARRLGQGDEC